ncbi:MAG TPA: hypothetical protein PLQ36_02625 [Candidatus Gracilibacteria bacterium]|nr:hypothetical protein [Candidatus Gracilibacteria bacterium]
MSKHWHQTVWSYLGLALLVCLSPLVANAANIYPGYCQVYKTHYDRSKIPNYSVSHYLDGLSPLESQKRLREIRDDQICMNTADLEKKRNKISSEQEKRLIQIQIDSLNRERQKIQDELKILAEKNERINKFLATLRNQSKWGSELSRKIIIDKQAEVIDDLDQDLPSYLLSEAEINLISQEISARLSEWEKLSDSQIQTDLNLVNRELKNQYRELKEGILQVESDYQNRVLALIKRQIAEDKTEMQFRIKSEATNPEELTGLENNLQEFLNERELEMTQDMRSLLNTLRQKYQPLMQHIEKVIGPVEVSVRPNLTWYSRLVSALDVEFLNENQTQVTTQMSLDFTNLLVDVDPLLAGLLSMMVDPEFNLVAVMGNDLALADRVKYLNSINNNTEIKKIISGLNQDLQKDLEDKINRQKILIMQEYDAQKDRVNLYLLDDPQDRQKNAKIIERINKTATRVLKIKQVNQQISDQAALVKSTLLDHQIKKLILEIALSYDGYADYLISKVKSLPAKTFENRKIVDSWHKKLIPMRSELDSYLNQLYLPEQNILLSKKLIHFL